MPVRLILPDFGWDSFVPPPNMVYQWVARSVMGDTALASGTYIEPMTRAGWRPVDARRYNRQFAILGNEIGIGGQVLMETEMRGAASLPASLPGLLPDNPFLQALLDAPERPDYDLSATEIWIKGWVGK